MRFASFAVLFALCPGYAASPLTPAEKAVLERISGESMKGHVAFLASDALSGRDTPSPGLEAAAEYIAAHFRRLKLEPAGDQGTYFQSAPFARVKQNLEGLELTLSAGGKTYSASKDTVSLPSSAPSGFESLPLVRADISNPAAFESLKPEDVAGKVVFIDTAALFSAPQEERRNLMRQAMALRGAVLKMKPALLIAPGFGMRQMSQLRDLSAPEAAAAAPMAAVSSNEFLQALRAAGEGATVSAKLPAPEIEKIGLRNVAAVWRGSDEKLKDTYVLITAHYDHVGTSTFGDGDRINNGANDNASGTSTVLELAEALARSGHRPKRSILFVLYFGEEKGLFGSRFYARKPLFPLARTVANLNLEQMGRTDDPGGDRTNKLTATGFTYTSMGEILLREAPRAGVEAWNDERNSEAFFARSDNQPLADAGVPAITLAAAWTFPDYHRPGDHWDKLNYDHMANLAGAVALTTLAIADAPEAPRWIESNPKTAPYVEAAKKLHGAAH